MTMQIVKISLYGINNERRDIDFEVGKVNIITGASKKGKSSLLEIVEYCLGASECTVAEGHIRNTVAWYSILLQFPDTQVFIARAAPLAGVKASSTACLIVSAVIDIPDSKGLEQNTSIDSVVKFLTGKIGIAENETEVPSDQSRSSISIGFKHSRYYLFQGQDEIAAKKILFHRQAEPHLPQAIKDTLPYFLGAADDNRLSDIEKLRALKQKRVVLSKRINEIESLKGDGLERGYALLSEAASAGMYENKNLIPSDEDLLIELRKIASWTPDERVLDEKTTDPLYLLEKKQKALSEEKSVIKMRLREATEYQASFSAYGDAVSEQGRRLRSIGLFSHVKAANDVCPVCESSGFKESKINNFISEAVEAISGKLDGVERSRPRIGSVVGELEELNRSIALEMRRTRLEVEAIKSSQIDSERRVSMDVLRSRTAGRISLYLDSVNWNENIDGIRLSLMRLESEIEALDAALDPDALQERLSSQLSCIADDMTIWARELGLEHSEHRIRLDHKSLTVVADTPHGPTPLYRMGSGENWVGYHLVTYLALAKWFIKQSRPVGRFIFFDQPTQVYFPADTALTGDINEIERDEDRSAVKKMFEWIFRVVEQLSPELQVIITDHADIDEDWFQSAVRDVKWRGDNALIPKHWYESL